MNCVIVWYPRGVGVRVFGDAMLVAIRHHLGSHWEARQIMASRHSHVACRLHFSTVDP